MKKNKKHYFYNFWIYTSGQSSRSFIKRYANKPSEDILKNDLQEWCESFSFYNVAHSWTQGYDLIKNPPKNRNDLLKKYNKVCSKLNKLNKEFELLKGFFNYPPYNGQKV